MFAFIDYYFKVLIKNILRLSFLILPIKRKSIMCVSFSGKQYSCNPKYISEFMLEHYPDFTIVWAFINPEKFKYLESKGIEIIKINSLKYIYYRLTFSVYITNCGEMPTLPTRPSQLYINTWHGGGCYKLGGIKNQQSNRKKYYMKKQIRSYQNANLFISPCRFDSIEEYQKGYLYSGKIAEIGYPRNDIFFKRNNINVNIKKYYNIPNTSKICIYAPTFRKYGELYDCHLDLTLLREALSKRFGGDWVILYRSHQSADGKEIAHNVISATNYPDMQELLVAADVLISDYSSSIWDYSLTFKPCFLFVPDLEAYNRERGFYVPLEKWGFPYAQSNKELFKLICNFNSKEYITAMNNHHHSLGSFENGTATESVANLIIDHINNL